MTHLLIHYGLIILFLLVAVESFGIPLPGETALITCAVLAAQGKYSIVSVILVASAAAIVGDNLGFWLIGRLGGRNLLTRWNWLGKYSGMYLTRTEKIMKRHGGKTVFFSRFITFLRFTAAWLAGIAGMEWKKFLFWNALGGVAWAAVVGLLAYLLGHAAAMAFSKFGFYGALVVIAVIGVYIAVRHYADNKAAKSL